MKKVLVTGCKGQLGSSLRREIEKDPTIEATFTDYDTLDITNRDDVEQFLAANDFDFIVNFSLRPSTPQLSATSGPQPRSMGRK